MWNWKRNRLRTVWQVDNWELIQAFEFMGLRMLLAQIEESNHDDADPIYQADDLFLR